MRIDRRRRGGGEEEEEEETGKVDEGRIAMDNG